MADGLLGRLGQAGLAFSAGTTSSNIDRIRAQSGLAQQQLEQQQADLAQQAQLQGLLGRVQTGQQPVQPLGGKGPRLPVEQQQAQGIQAEAQLAIQFHEQFEQVNKNLGLISQQQKDEAADFSFDLRNTPAPQRPAKIQQRVQSLSAQGRDASDTQSLLTLSEADQNEALEVAQVAALSTEKRVEIAQGGDAGFTLGQGQQRFDASGRPIAQVAPKEEAFTLAPGEQRFKAGEVVAEGKPLPGAVLPPALTEGLEPPVASKAEAAFVAAGGGKDGVAAFNKQVDVGNKISDQEAKILEEEKKATVKANVSRISTLSQGAKARNASIAKAERFKRQLEEGTAVRIL